MNNILEEYYLDPNTVENKDLITERIIGFREYLEQKIASELETYSFSHSLIKQGEKVSKENIGALIDKLKQELQRRLHEYNKIMSESKELLERAQYLAMMALDIDNAVDEETIGDDDPDSELNKTKDKLQEHYFKAEELKLHIKKFVEYKQVLDRIGSLGIKIDSFASWDIIGAVKYKKFENIDFVGCRLPKLNNGIIRNCTFTNCTLPELNDVTLRNIKFIETSYINGAKKPKTKCIDCSFEIVPDELDVFVHSFNDKCSFGGASLDSYLKSDSLIRMIEQIKREFAEVNHKMEVSFRGWDRDKNNEQNNINAHTILISKVRAKDYFKDGDKPALLINISKLGNILFSSYLKSLKLSSKYPELLKLKDRYFELEKAGRIEELNKVKQEISSKNNLPSFNDYVINNPEIAKHIKEIQNLDITKYRPIIFADNITLNNESLDFADLSYCNLANLKTKGASAFGVKAKNASFKNSDFSKDLLGKFIDRVKYVFVEKPLDYNNMSLCDFIGVQMNETNLSNVNISGSNFAGCDLSSANMPNANLSNVSMDEVNMIGAKMEQVSIINSSIKKCKIIASDLRSAKIKYNIIKDTDISSSSLKQASSLLNNYDNVLFKADDMQHFVESKSSFEHCEVELSNLKGAKFDQSNFSNFLIKYSDLSGVKMNLAKMEYTKIIGSRIENANISADKVINSGLIKNEGKNLAIDCKDIEGCFVFIPKAEQDLEGIKISEDTDLGKFLCYDFVLTALKVSQEQSKIANKEKELAELKQKQDELAEDNLKLEYGKGVYGFYQDLKKKCQKEMADKISNIPMIGWMASKFHTMDELTQTVLAFPKKVSDKLNGAINMLTFWNIFLSSLIIITAMVYARIFVKDVIELLKLEPYFETEKMKKVLEVINYSVGITFSIVGNMISNRLGFFNSHGLGEKERLAIENNNKEIEKLRVKEKAIGEEIAKLKANKEKLNLQYEQESQDPERNKKLSNVDIDSFIASGMEADTGLLDDMIATVNDVGKANAAQGGPAAVPVAEIEAKPANDVVSFLQRLKEEKSKEKLLLARG